MSNNIAVDGLDIDSESESPSNSKMEERKI